MSKGKVKRFYVIGDSHVYIFLLNKYFSVFHIGAITAFNIFNEKSTTASYRKIMNVVNKLPMNSNIIFVAGEIDCRIHIYKKYMQSANEKYDELKEISYTSFDNLINSTIDNYVAFMNYIINKGMIVYVLSIAPANVQTNIYKYPFFANIETQAMIKKRFNELLKIRCSLTKISYIDLYKYVVNSKGMMIDKYKADEVHLNRKVVKFVMKQINLGENSI